MAKILLVEDDVKLRDELKVFLNNHGYEVEIICDFQDTLNDIIKSSCDLILMDINIPGVNGDFLCREVRKVSTMPIIMVTSRNNDIDEVLCLSYGADDYITKPYNPQILLVRIETVLKRVNQVNNDRIEYKGLSLNISKSMLECDGNEIELSKNETRIFYYLLKKVGVITTREEIMDYLWGSEEFVDDNTLTVNINRLRKKLEEIGYQDVIETRRGQGYIIS